MQGRTEPGGSIASQYFSRRRNFVARTDESETFRPYGRLGARTPAVSERRAEGRNRCPRIPERMTTRVKIQGNSNDARGAPNSIWLHVHAVEKDVRGLLHQLQRSRLLVEVAHPQSTDTDTVRS